MNNDNIPARAFADGELSATTDFAWDELERNLGEIGEVDRLAGVDCFRLLTSWVSAGYGNHAKFVRFLAIASALHPENFPNLTRMAYEAGVTKAAMSRASKLAEKHFGIRFARSKKASSCAAMAKRRTGGPSRRSKAKVSVETADSAMDAPEATQGAGKGIAAAPSAGPRSSAPIRVAEGDVSPLA